MHDEESRSKLADSAIKLSTSADRLCDAVMELKANMSAFTAALHEFVLLTRKDVGHAE